MDILNNNQYNQAIGKSKLVGSAGGVGSVISSKLGCYFMVSDVNKWPFIRDVQEIVENFPVSGTPDELMKTIKSQTRLNVIRDNRFVSFLQQERDLDKLRVLVEIPDMNVTDSNNFVDWTNNPLNNNNTTAERYMPIASHFPKWFVNGQGKLKTYWLWKKQWENNKLNRNNFVPPRDSSQPIKDKNNNHISKILGRQNYPLYQKLRQTNLALICPNGHISDIPWPKFLNHRSQKGFSMDAPDLFWTDNCCDSPDLKWTENRNLSVGYDNIWIECVNCKKKTNLAGINSLAPFCSKHKPWEDQIDNGAFVRGIDTDCIDNAGNRNKMQVTLVTGNNMYYADIASSIYIPIELVNPMLPEVREALTFLEQKYDADKIWDPGLTEEQWWEKRYQQLPNVLSQLNLNITIQMHDFLQALKEKFITIPNIVENVYEDFRWQEYDCLTSYESTPEDVNGVKIEDIRFKDIELPESLSPYFTKIQQIEKLRVTNVQLGFSRVNPIERVVMANGQVKSNQNGSAIHSLPKADVRVLPANTVLGEGLFFQLNDKKIQEWCEKNKGILSNRYSRFKQKNVDSNDPAYGMIMKIAYGGADVTMSWKFFLIHTFAHALIRELEFSCGYPTASLSERLYISPRMSGFMVYTAEGSEGSMGGLVWQGQPENMEALVLKALERTQDCSSDPLCWESDGQGLYDLNMASCFSCSLISETSCENMNVGLDRRILVDEEYGFFKNL